jgi:hypothetical protein
VDSGTPLVVLPAALIGLLEPLRALISDAMPSVAVIGGVGVTIRLATAEPGHRATADIDVVADDREPAAIEVLAQDHAQIREQTAIVAGIEVDPRAHAAGFARQTRRASKHGGDLYDIYRLLEVFDAQGAVRADLHRALADTGRIVARVIEVEMLSNPARTLRQMTSSSSQPLDADRIVDVLQPFVDELVGSTSEA